MVSPGNNTGNTTETTTVTDDPAGPTQPTYDASTWVVLA